MSRKRIVEKPVAQPERRQYTRREMETLGWEWCADIIDVATGRRGKFIHTQGDEEGERIMALIDEGKTKTVAEIQEALRVAREKNQKMLLNRGD